MRVIGLELETWRTGYTNYKEARTIRRPSNRRVENMKRNKLYIANIVDVPWLLFVNTGISKFRLGHET